MKTENLTPVEAMQEWLNGRKVKDEYGWIKWREKNNFFEMNKNMYDGEKMHCKNVPHFYGSTYSIVELEPETLTVDEAIEYLTEGFPIKENKILIKTVKHSIYKWSGKILKWSNCTNSDGFLWLNLAERNQWAITKVEE